jgi:hypothetical protein
MLPGQGPVGGHAHRAPASGPYGGCNACAKGAYFQSSGVSAHPEG